MRKLFYIINVLLLVVIVSSCSKTTRYEELSPELANIYIDMQAPKYNEYSTSQQNRIKEIRKEMLQVVELNGYDQRGDNFFLLERISKGSFDDMWYNAVIVIKDDIFYFKLENQSTLLGSLKYIVEDEEEEMGSDVRRLFEYYLNDLMQDDVNIEDLDTEHYLYYTHVIQPARNGLEQKMESYQIGE